MGQLTQSMQIGKIKTINIIIKRENAFRKIRTWDFKCCIGVNFVNGVHCLFLEKSRPGILNIVLV